MLHSKWLVIGRKTSTELIDITHHQLHHQIYTAWITNLSAGLTCSDNAMNICLPFVKQFVCCLS